MDTKLMVDADVPAATDEDMKKKAYKAGWLFGSNAEKLTDKCLNYLPMDASNSAMASAYQRYNFDKFKYTKKEYVSNPIGLIQVLPFNIDAASTKPIQSQMIAQSSDQFIKLNFSQLHDIPTFALASKNAKLQETIF